jgi:methyltransferase family protein
MVDVSDFATFVFDQLPPPPCRVLEIGCGEAGGLVAELVARGYEALGVDPAAPAGERFLRTTFQEARKSLLRGSWDAVVAGRVLHHVRPLGEGLDLVASLAPLLVVDEFAVDLIDAAAQDWYERQHSLLRAAGVEPYGPRDLDAWRDRHRDLHAHTALLEGLRARYEERTLEWVPYFHHWLNGPSSEALEQSLVDARAIPAVGYRWAGYRAAGASTSTTRSSAPSR